MKKLEEHPACNGLRRGRALAALTLLLVAIMAEHPAAADQYDVVNVVLGSGVRRDSNLFRQPTAVADTITDGYLGLKVDKPYAQQRFQLDVTQNVTRYENKSSLNFDGINYRGAWLWRIGPHFGGTLTSDRNQSQVPFEDTRGNTQRNVRVNQSDAFTVDGLISGGWHALASVSRVDQTSEQSVQTSPDFSASYGELGIRYDRPSMYSITGSRRTSDGQYRNSTGLPIATSPDYRQKESELKLSWTVSGNSSLNARVAWLERDNAIPAQPDFSGPSSDVSYIWSPNGYLSVSIFGARITGALTNPNYSYSETTSLAIAPTWKFSEKTSLTLRLERVDVKYLGQGPVPLVGPAHTDSTDTATLSMNWLPMRTLSVGASLLRRERTSNDPTYVYSSTVGSINAGLTF